MVRLLFIIRQWKRSEVGIESVFSHFDHRKIANIYIKINVDLVAVYEISSVTAVCLTVIYLQSFWK